MEIKKYDYTYKYDGKKFDVIFDNGVDKPNVLFKLYSLNQYSFDALINQYIYATHPSQLNDIFDCNEDLLDFDDKDVIRIFLKDAFSETEIDDIFKSDFKNIQTFAKRNFREIVYRKWGVFSMTGDPNNILMWSYYNNHAGFCIEFDISKFPFEFQGPFPINYQDKIKPLSIKEIGIQLGVLIQSNLKFKGWEHENEWRLLIDAPKGEDMYTPQFEMLKKLGGHNRKFNYSIEAIKSIALGNKFFDPNEIKEINNTELEINLKRNFEQKSIMLEYLSENKITTLIALKTELTEIKFKSMRISRIDFKTYKLNAS